MRPCVSKGMVSLGTAAQKRRTEKKTSDYIMIVDNILSTTTIPNEEHKR